MLTPATFSVKVEITTLLRWIQFFAVAYHGTNVKSCHLHENATAYGSKPNVLLETLKHTTVFENTLNKKNLRRKKNKNTSP